MSGRAVPSLIEAQRLSGALPVLIAEARRIAAGIVAGAHGRRHGGQGEDFWQYRPYFSGDGAGLIDWRRSARSARLFVRQTEAQSAQSVWLWPDRSASMVWRGDRDRTSKRYVAELLLLALADLLLRGGERVGLIGAMDRPVSGHGALARLYGALGRGDYDAGRGFSEDPGAVPAYATVVLIGDFLDPIDGLAARLRRLAARKLSGLLIQVIDPAEQLLPYRGRVTFIDPETDASLDVPRVDALRAAYRRRFDARQAALDGLARDLGWRWLCHRTDRAPETLLLAVASLLTAATHGAR